MAAVFGGAILILGVVILIFALYLFIKQQAFLKKARVATGEVVGHRRWAGENGWLYRAVIEFETEAGQTVTFEDSLEANSIRQQRGALVRVLYDPARPSNARIYSNASLWLPCLVTVVVGFLVMAVGGIVEVVHLLRLWV